jgi:hypothetical protein
MMSSGEKFINSKLYNTIGTSATADCAGGTDVWLLTEPTKFVFREFIV